MKCPHCQGFIPNEPATPKPLLLRYRRHVAHAVLGMPVYLDPVAPGEDGYDEAAYETHYVFSHIAKRRDAP